jgi:PAS domain S-box-containing protein
MKTLTSEPAVAPIQHPVVERLMLIGFAATCAVLSVVCAGALAQGGALAPLEIGLSIGLLCLFAGLLWLARRQSHAAAAGKTAAAGESVLRAAALQDAILNSTNFASIATDANGIIQRFSAGAQQLLDYAADDVVGRLTPARLANADELAERAAHLAREFNTAIEPGFEVLVYKAARGIKDVYDLGFMRPDGSTFPALVSATALRDTDGTVIGFLLIAIDNTARKLVEANQALLDQRLRDHQFYTRSLIDSNIDALITTDQRGIISDINHQMEMLTGRSRDELIGTPFSSCFTDPERADVAIARALKESKLTDYELTALARNGKQTVVSFNATTFHDHSRKLQGVIAAARDVTERKQFEQALQESNLELQAAREAAEKANRAKSEFLSSMSHELRTPLNAVLGFAQLMASDVPSPSQNQQRSIDQILKGGWYLLRLINEILDLSMIEAGKVTMSQESMAISDVLQDCKEMIGPQAAKRGIALEFPQLDDVFYVHADRTRIKQVMINLLSNAIKYNGAAGRITVQCVGIGGQRVRISVADTGAGLSAEQLAQLFEPFNRLGQHDGFEEGTGIGLVVTKQLVELMGGHIEVESKVGVGTVFSVEFAASAPPALALDNVDDTSLLRHLASRQPGNLPTLLYVEDNPANLVLIEQLVARRGDLKLLTAIDGDLGIELALTYVPDVILMDINLPGISGYGALKRLREDPITAHIPVLALSANALPRDVEKGLEAGFLRYLTKPIRVHEFMDGLDLALGNAAIAASTLQSAGDSQ